MHFLCRKIVACMAIVAVAALSSGQTLLQSYESDSDFTKPPMEPNLCTPVRGVQGVTNGTSAAYAAFPAAPSGYPGFNSIYSTPQNFSGYGLIGFDVTNLGPTAQRIYFVLTDTSGLKLDQYFDVRIGETRPCAMLLNTEQPSTYGLRSFPLFMNGLNLQQPIIPNNFKFNSIKKIGFYIRKPTENTYFAFDNIRAYPTFTWNTVLTGTVDRYGQRTWGNVPGQISSVADLVSRLSSELTHLNSVPAYDDRTTIGSWKTGPLIGNQWGYFRTIKYKTRWWFLAPDGRLFFSSGLDGMIPLNPGTAQNGREYMFNWWPSAADPENQFVSTQKVNGVNSPVYDFTAANIFNKYGDVGANWLARTILRRQKWGFNTSGCFVDHSLWNVPDSPFTVELVTDAAAKRFTVQNTAKKMIDIYDAAFPGYTDSAVQYMVSANNLKTNVNLIGYTTDNELAFRSQASEIDLPISILGYDSTALATKAYFVNKLKLTYPTITDLNTAWGTTFPDWNTVKKPVKVTVQTPAFIADMKAFVTTFSKKYFSTWKASLTKYDPNHLYLGSKADYLSADVIAGMVGYCNVVSINRYDKTLANDINLIKGFDFPIYLSEFGASCPRGNNFALGISAAMADSQAERADILESVFRQALASKYFVGAHFFRMYDDPVTGSYRDMNNANWGICDTTDTPYPEIVAMFEKVNKDIYKRP